MKNCKSEQRHNLFKLFHNTCIHQLIFNSNYLLVLMKKKNIKLYVIIRTTIIK